MDVTSNDEKGWPPLPTLLPLRARWVADKGAPGGKKDSQEGERRRRCRRAMEIEWGVGPTDMWVPLFVMFYLTDMWVPLFVMFYLIDM